MGDWMKARNTKWSDEDEERLETIRHFLHLDNRSQAVRSAIRLLYELIVTGIFVEVLARIQGPQCVQSVRTPVRDRYSWRGIAPSHEEARQCMEMLRWEAS